MSDKKKLLIAYRVEGDAAKIIFAGNPDVAAESEIKEPEKGMAVLIQDEGQLDEINEALKESLKLISAGCLQEFVIQIDNVEHMIEQAARTVRVLEGILEIALAEEDDEEDADDDAE